MRGISAWWLAIVLLAGCVPNRAYRTTVGVCAGPECRTGSIELHEVNTEPPVAYMLGVVEFDDQGGTYERAQMDTLFDRLKAESATQDLCLVVFVHGWTHNAEYGDPNVIAFRMLLEQLARTESQHGSGAWNKPRKVVGIYAGWRGQSINAGLLTDLTFWGRKDAAQRVAVGSIRELLGRAKALRDTLDRTTWSGKWLPADTPAPSGETLRSTRLLTIGHSFGGLIVYTALAQYLTDRAAASATVASFAGAGETDKMIAGYGDLVVIINPAVEAIAWEPVRQLVAGRKAADYARLQKPVFVEVTSTADDATGIAFPAGRSLNTATENFVSAEERREAMVALGHYKPFWTHDLTKAPDAPTPPLQQPSLGQMTKAQAHDVTASVLDEECRQHAAFEAAWRRDGRLLPGWARRYADGAILTHRAASDYDANDPYWIVRADASVIASHSDISEPVFVGFVRQLYDELLLDDSPCR